MKIKTAVKTQIESAVSASGCQFSQRVSAAAAINLAARKHAPASIGGKMAPQTSNVFKLKRIALNTAANRRKFAQMTNDK